MYFLNCLIIFEVVVYQLDVTRDKSPHSHNPAHNNVLIISNMNGQKRTYRRRCKRSADMLRVYQGTLINVRIRASDLTLPCGGARLSLCYLSPRYNVYVR